MFKIQQFFVLPRPSDLVIPHLPAYWYMHKIVPSYYKCIFLYVYFVEGDEHQKQIAWFGIYYAITEYLTFEVKFINYILQKLCQIHCYRSTSVDLPSQFLQNELWTVFEWTHRSFHMEQSIYLTTKSNKNINVIWRVNEDNKKGCECNFCSATLFPSLWALGACIFYLETFFSHLWIFYYFCHLFTFHVIICLSFVFLHAEMK